MFECEVTVTLRKTDLPTMQGFLSLQKVKLPIDVCWLESADFQWSWQICHHWETL